MITADLIVRSLLGIDQRIPAPPKTAAEMDNWRTDWETGGWSNRVGYEKLFTGQAAFAPFTALGPIDTVYLWSERSTALRWLLFESAGVLYLVNYAKSALMVLESNRRQYALDEAGTSYVPTPAGLLVANGQRVKRFNGWPVDLEQLTFRSDTFVSHGYELFPPAPSGYSVLEGPSNFDTPLGGGLTANATANRSQDVGLGTLTAEEVHEYRWRISFVDQTGSESALSPPSSASSWTNGLVGDSLRKVVPVEIDVGPIGTVARRIYRTPYSEDSYKLVSELSNNVERLFYDSVPDSALGIPAPVDLVPMPAPGARYAASAANCVFFDGGPTNAQAVFWTMPGSSAQFSVGDFAYLGGSGGDITGLAGHYNAVIIFREFSVDVATGVYPDFRVATLLTDAGGCAPASAKPVPGHGIIFLADDGVYALTGGLEGGSEARAVRISAPIQGYINRINPAMVAAAQAVVCRKWMEYQLWVAIDGSASLNIGLIYHYGAKQWTVRTGWPVKCVASTPEGLAVFGHSTGASGSADLEGGLFVMSEARQMGYTKIGDAFVSSPPPTSVYLSRLESMRDAADKKHLRYVYVSQMTTGSNSTPVQAEADRGAVVNLGPSLVSQPADRALQPTYTEGVATEAAVWGTAKWATPLPVDVRYSVVLDGASYMQFRLSTPNDIVMTGYALGVVTSPTKVIEGRTPTVRRGM